VLVARVRVLLADDNEEMRDILMSVLPDGFDVIQAVGDGRAALSAATELHPDVAILDISMPVLNGIEVARRLRETSANVVVVFVTACSDIDVFHAAGEIGCLAYVLKSRLCTDLVPALNLQ
jgi:two-component system, response regulator PdtaR